jgi:hypothetical protein
MVSEATVEEVMESPNPEVTMTVAEKSASETAGASTAQDMALVLVSIPLPTSSPVGHASSSQRLEDDVVLPFDATHHLSKLTVAWENLSAGAASFGEQLQVGIFFFLVFGILASFTSSHFLPLFCEGSLSLGITLVSLAQVRLRRNYPLN